MMNRKGRFNPMSTEYPDSAPAGAPSCWSCNTVNKPGARFCRSCGASMDNPRPVEPQVGTAVEPEPSQETPLGPPTAVEPEPASHTYSPPSSAPAVPGDNRNLVIVITGI